MNAEPNIRALLIGIDHYPPGEGAAAPYPSLAGCARDIEDVDAFLRERLLVPRARISRLVAPRPDDAPAPADAAYPTYGGLVRAFGQLIESVRPDEQVYIHYSGHGNRARTRFPALKGDGGLDEVLVPADIAGAAGRYFTDVEMAFVLRRLGERGAWVTLVLDCCHSGGMTRSPASAARGGHAPDLRPRPAGSALASPAALAATWRDGGVSRGARAFVPATPGDRYTLLSACRQHERAFEHCFDGQRVRGVLTHFLLRALPAVGALASYRALHDRLLGEIHGRFQQTPQLEGDEARAVLGRERLPVAQGVRVTRVDERAVALNGGRAHGLGPGTRLVVHPPGASERSPSPSLPLIEVREATAVWAQAAVIAPGTPAIAPGALALPVLATLPTRRTVRVLPDAEAAALAGAAAAGAVALAAALEVALAASPARLVTNSATDADFLVLCRGDGAIEIADGDGVALPHLEPPLTLAQADVAVRLERRLTHLGRYHNVRALFNDGGRLAHALGVELFALPPGYDAREPPVIADDALPLGPEVHVRAPAWLCLRVRNQSASTLNVTILDLQPDWAISRLYPADAPYRTLDPGAVEAVAVRFFLPAGWSHGTDVLKLFATVDATDFDWLTLPPLDEPPPAPRHAAHGLTERLMASLACAPPATRTAALAGAADALWYARNLEVHVDGAA